MFRVDSAPFMLLPAALKLVFSFSIMPITIPESGDIDISWQRMPLSKEVEEVKDRREADLPAKEAERGGVCSHLSHRRIAAELQVQPVGHESADIHLVVPVLLRAVAEPEASSFMILATVLVGPRPAPCRLGGDLPVSVTARAFMVDGRGLIPLLQVSLERVQMPEAI